MTSNRLRLIFMGSPDFAVPTFRGLMDAGHEIVAVYTQPPRPAGRGKKPRPTPVHAQAEEAGIPVFTPRSLKSAEEQARFAAFEADAAVVVAYGLILPQAILDAPRHGCYNLHASLLPRWRGAAPIQRAIMAGDDKTGVCVMKMEAGLDTGPVCACEEVLITPDMTAGELHDLLAEKGALLMVSAMNRLAAEGRLDCRPQPREGATYAPKIEKEEAAIDFSRPAAAVLAQIHGLSPYPGAWALLPTAKGDMRIRILKAERVSVPSAEKAAPGTVLDENFTIACKEGAIRPLVVQRAGKAPLDRAAFLRGTPVTPGTRLSGKHEASAEASAKDEKA
ncbi:methionyl-tRNA formyltransferase [Thermopetrobacter sp. TC1]|uniref:methionyl-tRNA formyltransferase n=1 Tax=Thermopetrobacter sp. TC1 TaxID=1495045 RepID=UPI00056E581E|nr:methionyl-tRNA formyltransferase [Thermopetrobacter sp. TC1]